MRYISNSLGKVFVDTLTLVILKLEIIPTRETEQRLLHIFHPDVPSKKLFLIDDHMLSKHQQFCIINF